jgi:large subunit ribosomal protein L4
MPEIEVRNWQNKTVRTLELDPVVFDYPLKKHLVYEAVLAYQAAGRSGTHKTKNRVEVSGGTRKLWRQKHTGRARMGDNRSPLWRHGGTVHGPTPRSYAWRMPKRMRLNALRSALAQSLREGKIVCIDDLALESHRTKELEQALAGGLGIEGKALLVPLEDERNLELAARNNPRLKVSRALGLNVVDILHHDTLLISEQALQKLSEVLAP